MDDLRRDYVEQIRRDDLTLAPGLATAFATVPREAFVPDGFRRRDGSWAEPADPDFLPLVYRDDVLVTKVDDGVPVSSSSQPSLMAIMISALDVRPGLRILEIGAGTGYNAALLASLGATVTTVDVQADVADRARSALARARITGVRVEHGDGYAGVPGGHFDRVIVTVGVAGVSPRWLEQLTPDGLIVAPVEHAGTQPVLSIRRRGSASAGTEPADGRAQHRPQSLADLVDEPPDSTLTGTAGRAAVPDSPLTGAAGQAAALDSPLTGTAVCPAGFMTAAGPLTADHPGAFPAPAAAGTLPRLAAFAPPRFPRPLGALAYRDLWYAAGAWSRRATHAAVPHREHSCLVLLDEQRAGGAVILADGSVLAGGAGADSLGDEAVAVLDRWIGAGRPPMRAWRVGFGLTGDAQAPIWVPDSWDLPDRRGGHHRPRRRSRQGRPSGS